MGKSAVNIGQNYFPNEDLSEANLLYYIIGADLLGFYLAPSFLKIFWQRNS